MDRRAATYPGDNALQIVWRQQICFVEHQHDRYARLHVRNVHQDTAVTSSGPVSGKKALLVRHCHSMGHACSAVTRNRVAVAASKGGRASENTINACA